MILISIFVVAIIVQIGLIINLKLKHDNLKDKNDNIPNTSDSVLENFSEKQNNFFIDML